jgi:RNA polymerase sigma factor for flagellar operon FliA
MTASASSDATRTATPAPVALTAQEIRTLVEEHLPLVQHVLYQVAAHYPRHADREELAQSATLGLVEAAHRFDPSRGVPFARWASVRIRGAIVDAARALDFAPRSVRAAAREVEETQSALTGRLGRVPTADEIAQQMGVPVRDLHELQGKVHRALVLSLDAPCGEEDGDLLTLADGLVEFTEGDPAERLEEREQAAYLADALALLPDRLRVVVEGYFLLGRSSAELAEELGVTESRVSQMRSEALGLMRAGLAEQYRDAGVATVSQEPMTTRAANRQAAYAAALGARTSFGARVSRGTVAARYSA